MPVWPQSDGDATSAQRLAFLFGLVYFAQGFGQDSGLAAQPLTYFFKESLGFDPAESTEYLAILIIPWTIKPLYGLVSDFVPLAGYRRKSWLLLANAAAVAGFLWLVGVTSPPAIVAALMVTAFGMAAADVIIDAVMVENGRRLGLTAHFQSIQWIWMSLASICASLLGGALCSLLTPKGALQAAALIAVLAPLAVMVASWLALEEQRAAPDQQGLQATRAALREAARSRPLWAVVAFLVFWDFSPGFGTPWYYHQTDKLLFSQAFIGALGAVDSVGQALGAIAYWRVFSHMPIRRQLSIGIIWGTAGTLAYILMLQPSAWSHIVALPIHLLVGVATIISLLATLTLAARACPPGAEGFTFAAIMGVGNGVAQISSVIGARLYTDVFQSMLPLLLVSAAMTLACFLLLPILGPAASDAEPAGTARDPAAAE